MLYDEMTETTSINEKRSNPKEDNDSSTGAGAIDPRNEVKGFQLVVVHLALCLSNFLAGLDFNVVATAIPTITSRFNSIQDVGWYGAAFYIALCASQPFSGKIYVLFNKKYAFLSYIGIFELGNLVCALAPSSHALIIGRAVAGLGSSGIFAGTLVIMTTVMPIHKRAIWQSTLIATFGIASIVGPLIGGGLTQHASWRWCFYINLPLGGLVATITLLLLSLKPAPTEQIPFGQKLKGLDGLGFLLFAGPVAMLLLALQWGGTSYPWNSSVIIGLLVGTGITIPLFVAWQVYMGEHALIPMSILANRNVGLLCLGALFSNGPFQTIIYYIPIWFQVQGATPTASGVKYLPTVIADVLTSFISGALVMKFGHWKPFNLFGYVLLSLASGFLTGLYPGVSAGRWIGLEILLGVGYSLAVSMPQLGVQATLPPDIVHIGSTTLLFAMSISCAISLAIGQAIFQLQLRHYLAKVVPRDTIEAILAAGATHITSAVRPEDYEKVIRQYSNALTDIFFLPAIGPVMSFIFVFFTTWIVLQTKKSEPGDEIKEPHDSKTANGDGT